MDYTGIWNEVIKELEKTITAISCDVFVRPLTAVGIHDNKLVLFSETANTKAVIIRNYLPQIVQAITRCGYDLGVLVIDPTEKDEYAKKEDEPPAASIAGAGLESVPFESGLNPKYTFDTFVVGNNNMFVQAAAQAVAESPGDTYNPLFIYGGVGLGKTHIMHAVGNYINKKHPELKVMYVTSERFTNELIDSIRAGRDRNHAQNFRNRYRSTDVLMIDDIQFIANKTSTQEEIFHTFNDLYASGKQIIISSDRPPREINPLEERLRSRFASGLLADIQPPDLETRIAILQKKALSLNYAMPIDVIHFIAEQNDSNIRIMEENLARVYFHSKLFEQELSIDIAAKVLKDNNADSNEAVSINVIIDVVCKYYKVAKEDLIGKKKNKEIVYPRQICIYLITEILSMPLASIGQIFGGRDHTTIMYARNKIADDLRNNDNIKRALQDIRNMIYKK